jgi:hypothetical protein
MAARLMVLSGEPSSLSASHSNGHSDSDNNSNTNWVLVHQQQPRYEARCCGGCLCLCLCPCLSPCLCQQATQGSASSPR